jgi:mono/diheme cytochrome c family protein
MSELAIDADELAEQAQAAEDDPASVPPGQDSTLVQEGCLFDLVRPRASGQAIAVAFVSERQIAVQTREPAALVLFDLPDLTVAIDPSTPITPVEIALADESRDDTGHDLFHLRAGNGIACASCHAEGGDDGHVWDFEDKGPRRTQYLRAGLAGTEPLHWDGELPTFADLAEQVFVGRMGGSVVNPQQIAAAARWVDQQPRLAVTPDDPDAAERGRALFESEQVGCSGCHSGEHLTDNRTVDVGTGGPIQVPSLRGVAFHAPYLHDGCAASLEERFGQCGGGDQHGNTSQLSAEEQADLIAYLETL